jgi:hypothetical protein
MDQRPKNYVWLVVVPFILVIAILVIIWAVRRPLQANMTKTPAAIQTIPR